MKTRLAGLTLATVAALGAAGPAFAGGDVIYTGVKDPYAAAVPVPAPAPIPIYEPEYYVRFDVGAAWLSDGTIEEYGSALDVKDPEAVETIEYGSIGAGRYLTPSIRVELQVDLATKAEISNPGASIYTSTRQASGPTYDVLDISTGVTTTYNTFDTKFYDVTRTEDIDYEQDVGLINLYYDFRNGTRFTPYVGAGVGVSYRTLTRKVQESAVCSDTVNSNPGVDVTYPTPFCTNSTDLPNEYETSAQYSKNRWDIVASLSAGLAYQVTDSIIWDTGYRYLWQNGGLSLTTDTVSGTSTVEVKDIGQHQLRTGIRLNLN